MINKINTHGLCNQPCFGPVWKIKIFNELSKGLLHVEGNMVLANYTRKGKCIVNYFQQNFYKTSKIFRKIVSFSGEIYKISHGSSFSLYDANADRFICWKKEHAKVTIVPKVPSLLKSALHPLPPSPLSLSRHPLFRTLSSFPPHSCLNSVFMT